MTRLFLGWVVVLLYVGALTPAGPLLTALLGKFDADHQLEMGATTEGVSVVLHHGDKCLRSHHHGLIARTLTAFAQPAGQNGPDHVVQFHSNATLSKDNGVAVITKNLASSPLLAFIPAETTLPLPSTTFVRMASAPPDQPASLDSLRSVCLLI